MKKLVLLASIAVFMMANVNAQNALKKAADDLKVDGSALVVKKGPAITFKEEVIDYGTIEQGADGVREFKFTNTGNEPLIISNSRGSCGCTVPTWPKEPIKPGESSVIKVKYDTKRLGAINKSVTITSNAIDSPTKVVRIKGTIKAPTALTPTKDNPLAPTTKE